MSLLLVPDADRSLRPPTTYARPERRRQALDGNPSVVYPHGDGRRRVGKEQPEGNGARAEPYIRDLEGRRDRLTCVMRKCKYDKRAGLLVHRSSTRWTGSRGR
ncbi:unnamed protein product [Ectocarpus sp. 12 AP-2014]